MKIDNEFTVSVPIDQTWEVLTDLAGIAACLPGAQLTGSEGASYIGKIKIKVGPVTSEYAGTASFSEKDDAGYRAVQLPAPMAEAPAPKATGPQGGVVTIPKALTAPRTRKPAPEPEALDLMQLAGGSVAKRMVPVAIGVAVVAAVVIYRIVR